MKLLYLMCMLAPIASTNALGAVVTGDFAGDGILGTDDQLQAQGIDLFVSSTQEYHNGTTYVDYFLGSNSDYIFVPDALSEGTLVQPGEREQTGDIFMQASFFWFDPMDGSGDPGHWVWDFPYELDAMVYVAFSVAADDSVGYFQYERVSENTYLFHGWAHETDSSVGIQIRNLVPAPASTSLFAFGTAFLARRRR